jgi:hypothetical protein
MALKWVEGFESYSNLVNFIGQRYTTFVAPATTVFATGRAIGNSLNFTGTSMITPSFSNAATFFTGFAFRNVNLTASNVNMPVLEVKDAGTVQVFVTFNPSTRLFSIFRGATLLSTGTFALTTGAWYYVEFGVYIDPAIGTATLKINTVNDIVFGPGNTQVSANSFANIIAWKGPGAIGLAGSMQLDDMYICDDTSVLNNTYLGDMKVEGVQVIESGFWSDWGVNVAGTPNFQCVQVLNDGLYVTSNTIGNKDSYECSNLNKITSAIKGVSAIYWTRNTDSTVHTVESLIRQGGVDYLGTAMSINDTAFKAYQTIWATDPSTLAAWTVAGVGTAEFGQRLAS